ncbi:Ent-kaurene synthase, fungal, partial [Metarhizium majus ARSEF 297]
MNSKAKNIIKHLVESLNNPYHGSSSMTLAVYDTAWVSMVSKQVTHDGATSTRWLFPECFEIVLLNQSGNGGFGVNGAPVDGILSTMAALVSLIKHQNETSVQPTPALNLAERIERARLYLDQTLKCWDVHSTVHVGFEIIIPSMLRMLEKGGLHFEFPGREALMILNQRKLDKMEPETLYTSQRSTLLHSLEAFVGVVDFDKLSHFLRNGSMMNSPASTAAYLMNSTIWNHDAECYLRFITASTKGHIPSAFPISVFEISWALSTLLSSGFTAEALGKQNILKLASFLEGELQNNGGITGFARDVLPDADDTARSIQSLNLLGRRIRCEPMIEAFKGADCFKTYGVETSESFSANCNILITMLWADKPSQYVEYIFMALTFLFKAWKRAKWDDKWNCEPQYSMMVFATALVRAARLWDDGVITGLDTDFVKANIPLVTLQILIRTLSYQSEFGSWGDSPEVTAYGLLTLKTFANLPWVAPTIGSTVRERISLATQFLETKKEDWNNPANIWIEKVTFGSNIMSEAYCLAAMNCPLVSCNWTEKVSGLFNTSAKRLEVFSKFLARLPIFTMEPVWRLKASVMEGNMFEPLLQCAQRRLNIFPQQNQGISKYAEYITITWTTCNNAASTGLPPQIMLDMMVISMLNFQADKWLEEITMDNRLHGDFEAFENIVYYAFEEFGIDMGAGKGLTRVAKRRKLIDGTQHVRKDVRNSNNSSNGFSCSQETELDANGPILENDDKSLLLREAKMVLSRFISHITMSILGAPASAIHRVYQELLIFLQAHITQGEDNSQMPTKRESECGQLLQVFDSAGRTYYDWVRTTSANHTSCPYSFELFRCLVSSLLSPSSTDCFAGPRSLYLAQDVCRHLATMCRQYNDYGSITRDYAENNLNSVNFPEFHQGNTCGLITAREALMDLANYERECLDLAVNRLRPEIATPIWQALKVFIDVTDLYGQIYTVRDINT